METLIKIALGFLLLVSAAAATGNYNCVNVDVYQEAIGNCITGDVNLAQITDASAFLIGSYNSVDQSMDLYADDNCLTGNGRETNLIQRADFVGNASGSNNYICQDVDSLNAYCNSMTDSNLTQWTILNADTIGSCNSVYQGTGSNAYDDCLTLSDLKQIVDFNVCAVGDDNCVDQWLYQEAGDNCLTISRLWQQTSKVANILGCWNNVEQNENYQYADSNTLTGSVLNQVICESAQITGECNEVNQGSCESIITSAYNNCLTNAGMLQSINSKALEAGCNNYIDHEIGLYTDCNIITGGTLTQMSTVVSND